MVSPVVALQLYTVREDAARDFPGTLRAVAEVGYPAVQMAGYFDMAATDLRRLLDDLNLRVAGSHVGLDRLESHLDEEIAYARAIDTIDLVCPAIPEARRRTLDDYRSIAALLNRIGEGCRKAGARLSYHNHAFEFQRIDGTVPMDLLLAETDPSLVYFEPDVYWIERGGADPADYIRRHSGRCPIIHLKDVGKDEAGSFAEVGEGRLDFAPIFAASEAGGAEWYVVEQDRCQRPALESARISLDHLRAWGKA